MSTREKLSETITHEEKEKLYGNFDRKVKIHHERSGAMVVDFADYLDHPQVRFSMDFIEDHWDKIKSNE